MANPDLVMALAKVVIAAAWADGKLSNDEVNSLKDLLFRLPEMGAREWASLEMYLEAPVSDEERARLVAALQARLGRAADKRLALATLEEMIGADGEVTADERALVAEIKAALDEANVSIFGQVGRLLRGPVRRRSEMVAGAANREVHLDDFIKNKIYYNVRRRLNLEEGALDLSESELRKLSLAGGLMARVAWVDREISEGELESMRRLLTANWGITDKAAAVVAEVAASEVSRQLDYYRLARQFFECTTGEERAEFLDVLFAVADGDGRVSHEEIEEIRTIANRLKLAHRQFITAKLKIPRERRTS